MQQRTAFVLSLVLALVLSMTAFAAPLEHEGSLEFYWDKGSQLTHSEWAKLKYDLRKDFGYGFSAGLSISMSPSDTGGQFTHEWDGWANMDFGHTFVSLSSWQEFTGANFLMADGNKLKGGPGAIVDFKQLDNVAIQAHIGNYWNSEKEWVDGEEGEEGYWIQGMTYTYGAKATYDAGDYQVGLGVQGWWPEHEDLLMGGFLFGSTTLADGLTLEAEAAYRTDLEDWRYVPDWNYWYVGEYHTGKAFTAQASYEGYSQRNAVGCLQGSFFLMKSWDDPQTARDHYFMKEWSGVLLALDVEEEVIPYLTLNGSVDVLLGVEDPGMIQTLRKTMTSPLTASLARPATGLHWVPPFLLGITST